MDGLIKWILLLCFSMITLLFSCDTSQSDLPDVEDCEHYDYKDCNTVEPYDAEMTINFSISSKTKYVPFEVYKGYVDDQVLLFRDTSWSDQLTYNMPVNERYSIKAKYKKDGKTIYVIDGGKIKVHSKKVCDSTCWSVDNLELDAILK